MNNPPDYFTLYPCQGRTRTYTFSIDALTPTWPPCTSPMSRMANWHARRYTTRSSMRGSRWDGSRTTTVRLPARMAMSTSPTSSTTSLPATQPSCSCPPTWLPSFTSSARSPTPRIGRNRRERHPTMPSETAPHEMLYLCSVIPKQLLTLN